MGAETGAADGPSVPPVLVVGTETGADSGLEISKVGEDLVLGSSQMHPKGIVIV